MKKQTRELKSLSNEHFNVLKKNEMFNVSGGMPVTTYWENFSYSCGEAVDSLEGGKDTHNIPDEAPQPPAHTFYRSSDGCSRC